MGWQQDWLNIVAAQEQINRGNALGAAAIADPNVAKYVGESSRYIATGGAPEQKSALGGILKTVATIAVPVVAAIAAPFLAPVIGTGLAAIGLGGVGSALGLGALGGAAASGFGAGLTGAALGAGVGAGVGAATGRGALMGAVTGGLGGGIGAYGGLGQALGLGPAAGGTVGATGGLPVGVVGGAGGMAVPTFGAAATGGASGTLGLAGAAGTGALGAAAGSPMMSNIIGNLVGKFAEGITAGGIADLAMTMYNKPEEGLTEEEKRAVYDTANLAQTNQELFKQRVEQANAVWNTAQANPEKAYAEAVSGVQRGVRESQRRYGTGQYGGTGSERRQAGLARAGAIEAERAGSAAAAGETSRAQRDMASAAGLLPTSGAVGPSAATLPLFGLAQKRQEEYDKELARSVGGLFGGVYNRSRSPQFSINYGQ